MDFEKLFNKPPEVFDRAFHDKLKIGENDYNYNEINYVTKRDNALHTQSDLMSFQYFFIEIDNCLNVDVNKYSKYFINSVIYHVGMFPNTGIISECTDFDNGIIKQINNKTYIL